MHSMNLWNDVSDAPLAWLMLQGFRVQKKDLKLLIIID